MDTTPLPIPAVGTAGTGEIHDAEVGFAPNCPECLHTVEPWEVGRGAAWRCPECGLALIG